MAPGVPCKADILPKLKKIAACAALGPKKHWRHIHGNTRIFKKNKGGFTLKTGTIISNGIIIVLLLASTSAVAQILPEDPSRGGQLFVSKGCVKCHAVKGEGGKTGPDLGTISLGGTQLDLAAEIWNHTPSMIAGME
jgi:mono/diheme cytochrome c family protein